MKDEGTVLAIEKLGIKNGDILIVTVKDGNLFHPRDLMDGIRIWKKNHPEAKDWNVPIIIIDKNVSLGTTHPLFRMYCETCKCWSIPSSLAETKCGCLSENTKMWFEIPKEFRTKNEQIIN